LKSFVEIAAEIARESGAVISEFARRRVGFELKGTYDLVTEADRSSERLVVERLQQHFPSHAILAEEGGAHDGSSEYRWYVDPLDGTTNFAHGFPFYNVTLALERAGEFWLALEGARLLNDRAATLLDDAWAEDEALSHELRGDTAIAIATAKVAAIKGGMDVTTRMFDVMGARSTTGKFGFDRYWRNLRTHSSHDPVDYKLRELGDWALNDVAPVPTFYS